MVNEMFQVSIRRVDEPVGGLAQGVLGEVVVGTRRNEAVEPINRHIPIHVELISLYMTLLTCDVLSSPQITEESGSGFGTVAVTGLFDAFLQASESEIGGNERVTAGISPVKLFCLCHGSSDPRLQISLRSGEVGCVISIVGKREHESGG